MRDSRLGRRDSEGRDGSGVGEFGESTGLVPFRQGGVALKLQFGSGQAFNAGPEGLEVLVVEGEEAGGDGVVRDLDGAEEPFPAFVGSFELCGIAGQIVGDKGFLGKTFGGGVEDVPGGGETAGRGASEGVGVMEPASGGIRMALDEVFGGGDGFGPLVEFGVQVPLEFEGEGVLLGSGGEA